MQRACGLAELLQSIGESVDEHALCGIVVVEIAGVSDESAHVLVLQKRFDEFNAGVLITIGLGDNLCAHFVHDIRASLLRHFLNLRSVPFATAVQPSAHGPLLLFCGLLCIGQRPLQ